MADLGNLERVKRVLKTIGYVSSEEVFVDQVLKGVSNLLMDIFRDNGKHALVSVEIAEIPENVPVEIELIFEIKSVERMEDESDKCIISDRLLNLIEQQKKTKNQNR